MSEELKNKLDNFAKNIIMKSGSKKEVIPEIQKEYNELMEFYDTLTILTNDEFASLDKAMSKYEELQEEINIYKSKKDIDDDKIQLMKKELAENIGLKENNQKINDEYISLKQRYSCLYNDNIGFQMKLKTNEKIINDLQEEISNLKRENFEKFERINYLEKNYKLTQIKLSDAMEKISKYSVENNDLAKTNLELKNENLDLQKNYKSKIHVLERQVKHLSETNNNLLSENNNIQTQLKDLQMYTNMAKVNTKKLNFQDFSILETMSKRAENAEAEMLKLKTNLKELKAENEQLKHKIKPLEDYALLQMKYDHEINTGNNTVIDLNNKIFNEEEINDIKRLKNNPNELFQSLIKLKTENVKLHNQLNDIVIECNQQLREAKLKNNKK